MHKKPGSSPRRRGLRVAVAGLRNRQLFQGHDPHARIVEHAAELAAAGGANMLVTRGVASERRHNGVFIRRCEADFLMFLPFPFAASFFAARSYLAISA